MSNSLEAIATNQLKTILYKFTSNKYISVSIGIIITAIIQSSSATTVILISLLNSQLISLTQATWIVFGANIGTTITGLMIALDLGQSAIYLVIFGFLLLLFKNKFIYFAHTIISLGLIFLSLDIMSLSLAPIQNSKYLIKIFTQLNNPITSIIIGIIFTAIIQSSSASIGILQTIYQKGFLDFSMATNVIYGLNIGTCATALIATINSNNNAKRLAYIQILINLLGTLLFLIITNFIPIATYIKTLSSNHMMQIAYMHTFFNIVSTITLLPFYNILIYLAYKIIPYNVKKISK